MKTSLISINETLIITKQKISKPKEINKSDWIYVNMASVSVYRSYAKCVLGTKTLILPTQDNGWLSVPPTELCNYQQQQQQNFINKHLNLQKYCPQLARLFQAGQCVQNIKIETKAINIIILSRGLIQLSG